MNAFDTAAVLITVAAICSYVNHRFLRLPATTGILLVALAASLLVLLAETFVPAWHLKAALGHFLDEIDFNKALMHGMLGFLLFAAALHLDLEGLLENKWTIGSLSTVSVLISTFIVGALTWWVLGVLGVDISFVACLVFGALISPTDPIAVMGLLKELKAPRSLEAQIAGESLFNDGVSVVVFFALVSIAGLSEATTPAGKPRPSRLTRPLGCARPNHHAPTPRTRQRTPHPDRVPGSGCVAGQGLLRAHGSRTPSAPPASADRPH
jgi:CPA1 family monovalent cation:H+ antiporter